ncbi:signal recognition particle-docking protein FtsY [Acidothermus cellulolyticus 11B]|uniref:Signal recognition particle receptor FtsY n=1 Tax=Acidothermus cellulolyticus (strain ATCC 43068 / DSM 8971 / 11B) TaxID=351607 RepID=A0LV79_ACIC1|nr:signal recognition particle-docking protein FtsY [Acidothermus cellulolyticus]ABK53339.1 signal recognition particle-docking protein FtsY [Acidothermus cellulolyticus 11B]
MVWLIAALIGIVVLLAAGAVYLGVRAGRRPRGAGAGAPPATPATPATRQAEPVAQEAAPAVQQAQQAEPAVAPAAAPEAESAAAVAESAAAAGDERDVPAVAAGRMIRLRSRLARSESVLGRGLFALLSRERLDDATWQEIEDLLLTADVGVAATTELVERLRTEAKVMGVRSPDDVRAMLRRSLLDTVDAGLDRSLATTRTAAGPAVVLVVGVNGTGKTTTVGKLARLLVADGRSVVLGAADTFRAAAADQLETWGRRVGVPVVRGAERADPASVAFDAVRVAIEQEADVVVIDTAGRLHTKTGLMDELGKVKRVVERRCPVSEVLLVLDATTGQNGLTQARVFTDVVAVTGVVLTKLDGTAKGGIVISVQRELGIPVKLVGLGEGPDDLAPFDPAAFVDALLGVPEAFTSP